MSVGKVSACVNCKTPIIGDRSHCAACGGRYDDAFDGEVADDAATLPRPRHPKPLSRWQRLLAWIVIAQLFAVVVMLLFLAGRGCQ